jgi:hypothetical protein
MAHSRDQEIMRLHGLIEALERDNATLISMLSDAVGICDAALEKDDARRDELEGLREKLPLDGIWNDAVIRRWFVS